MPNNETAVEQWLHRMFPAHSWGNQGWLFLLAAIFISIVLVLAMTRLRPRGRKALIVSLTFLSGLYYALEFFWPTRMVDGQEQNIFTPFLPQANDFNLIIATLALGLGIYSLFSLHAKTLTRMQPGWFYSLTFFVSTFAMAFIGILAETGAHKDVVLNNELRDILYVGGLQALDSTMFSIIAFYIVSAAYRAFRIRSAEATLLMAAAFIVMLGQVYAGQVLTSRLPESGFFSNLRVEVLSDWLLTRVNAPAVRAVGFGLGVGLLATALRIWLSLERGSYFDREV